MTEIKKSNITMDKMKEILKNEYGIHNEKEFNEAVARSEGIDIGIFTQPYKEDK